MAESAVSLVLGNVGNLAAEETKFLCGVTNEVTFLKAALTRLQGYLRDADRKQRSGSRGVAILVSQIRDAACEAENAIEAADYMEKRNRIKKGFMGAISRYARLPSDLVTLHKLGADIQRVRRSLNEIFARANTLKIDLDNNNVDARCPVENEPPQESSHAKDDVVMVGFDDEHKKIVNMLVGKESMLKAVSIVAMGGAGKTTLARKVFTASRVKKHFEAVAWVTVSQNFKGVDLLKDILKQIMGGKDESVDLMQEYEVGKKISDLLLPKKYLVVLDDVWETDTWDQINRTGKAFPDAAKGSRILLTTRSKDVADHVDMETHVHALKQLDEDESWELFSSKALPPYRRSVVDDIDDFEEIGKKLARKCDGLPLALSVLGSYLSKNFNIQKWSDVLSGWPSTKDTHMMREILARSYKDLPSHHLRSCFLYLASFPEDYVIDVSDLIELWIAESFIPHTRSHKLEETARNYVSELAQRSLVQVVDRSKVHGWIEKIRVHDILSDWCIEKAREDGFLDVIDKTTGQKGASSSDTTRVYRYSYQNLRSDSLEAAPCWVRTVVCFGLTSVSIPKLRFLRVLHIQNSRLENLPSAIGGCIHVRCLRLRNCESVTLPSSIGQLLYLQTLDLRGTLLDSEVARSIWDITTLRHVFLQNGFRPPALARSKRQQRQTELQTLVLGLPFVATKKTYADMVIFLGQMNQLTTLNLPMRNIPGGMINIVEKMPDLVDAYISRFGMLDKLPAKFPESLQRLVQEADNLTQDPMPTLEKLPCLVVLVLTGHTGETISCSNKGFPRLQKLKLGDFRGEWNMAVGAMPKLSHLLLSKYSNLDGLPQALLHIRYLSYIGLTSMPWITEHNDSTLKKLLLKGCEVKRDDFLVI